MVAVAVVVGRQRRDTGFSSLVGEAVRKKKVIEILPNDKVKSWRGNDDWKQAKAEESL